ncbi:JmjC domain-containing protein [Streptomyces sp. NPDC090053]|uniref:JmjC domain-containing protein n=1 Tax=Streptomyces sp. NPDC090053 TaxID=3365932 RepID=UPI00380DA158
MLDTSQREMAFGVYTRLSSAVLPRRPPGSAMQLAHLPKSFDEQWIASLPIPAEDKPPGQTVALTDKTTFHREVSNEAVAAAYSERPRTRVYESIHARSDGWYSLVALRLAGLLRKRVVATLYESRAGDLALGAHDDGWDGVIVQLRGSKAWRLWPEPRSQPHDLLTRAGDILLLPRGITHQVVTPKYSAHLVLAVTDEPLVPPAS